MLLKCCTQCARKFVKMINDHRTGKGQFHSDPKEGIVMACSNSCTIVLISYAGNAMLKIPQSRFLQYVN